MKQITTLILIALLSLSVLGQEGSINRGDKKFDKYDFVDAQKVYLRVAENGFESAELFNKLGDSYYLNAQYDEAVKWYGQLFEKFPDDIKTESYFRYATSLKAVKDYDRADAMMNTFFEIKNEDKRARLFNSNKDYLKTITSKRNSYKIEPLNINTVYSDFGATLYEDKLIFSSARDTGSFSRRTHKWNAQPFLDLYEISIEELDGGNKNVKKFDRVINTKYHESTPAFSADGNTIYFTRNNFTKGNYRKDSNGTNKLKIYRATKGSSGKWGNAEELPFCSDDYNTGHPSLSSDGRTMYFTSDRPESVGESDLWKVAIEEDGSFGEPENLGDIINTEGRETFPYITSTNELYFASNGHQGLGGLDIFLVNLSENSDGEILNLGEPLNTAQDDFAAVLDEETRTGYFSSNRNAVGGNDDIYRFIEVPCDITLEGLITDRDTGAPISNVDVSIYDQNNNVIAVMNTASESSYSHLPGCSETLIIRARKEGYIPSEKVVVTPGETADLDEPLQLELEKKPFEKGDDLGKILNLNPIYFDFDRYNIRPDAALELAKVIAVMEEYPALKVDVRSHTDSRGDDEYNRVLSQNRNDATINYMIDQGIAKGRLTGRGYGESELINNCSNGSDCSEEDHQLNRRSEFIIVDN